MQSATSASTPSATQSTSKPILTASEQASENAAMAKMFSEVRKAEAKARAPQVDAVCDTSNVLRQLWERTASGLSNSELEYFAKATEHAQSEARHLRDVVMGIGCLIASDTQSGALQGADDTSAMLYVTLQQRT
jgi:hypothetical protein